MMCSSEAASPVPRNGRIVEAEQKGKQAEVERRRKAEEVKNQRIAEMKKKEKLAEAERKAKEYERIAQSKPRSAEKSSNLAQAERRLERMKIQSKREADAAMMKEKNKIQVRTHVLSLLTCSLVKNHFFVTNKSLILFVPGKITPLMLYIFFFRS